MQAPIDYQHRPGLRRKCRPGSLLEECPRLRDGSTIAASGRGIVRNYAGETADTLPRIYGRTLAGSAAPAWDFARQPQAVIINLGTNDISNGKGDPGTPFRGAPPLAHNGKGRTTVNPDVPR